MSSNVLKIVGTTILFGEEICALIKFAGCAAGALRRVGTVEVGNVAVANVSEPAKYRQGVSYNLIKVIRGFVDVMPYQ